MIDVSKIEAEAATVGDRVRAKMDLIRAEADKLHGLLNSIDSGVLGTIARHMPIIETVHNEITGLADMADLFVDVLDDLVDLGAKDLDSIANPGHAPALPQASAGPGGSSSTP